MDSSKETPDHAVLPSISRQSDLEDASSKRKKSWLDIEQMRGTLVSLFKSDQVILVPMPTADPRGTSVTCIGTNPKPSMLNALL